MKSNRILGQTKLITYLRENKIQHEVVSDTVGVIISIDEKELDNEQFEFLFFGQEFRTKNSKIFKNFPRLTFK